MMESVMTTQREKFMTRLAAAREVGLIDLKLFFAPAHSFSPEEIFGALNEIEDAIDSGKCTRHSGWDKNQMRA
jgi:hypothetical protein